MNYQSFKCNSSKEYLGFCDQKGFIYSVQLDTNNYAIVALYNGEVTTLIHYTVQSSAVQKKA
ncbi:hypothetical protein [Paenibacillus aceti]|uniref:Uncharacterized protein n=1 Tax=Paenibacillus aceti TaxID=1820010 RepID=A0ABQ1W085_9BACL|nr:hypothetical protein [Paenibacillus aceti]GGG07000.1 hypothetical protein GCM10010913_31030 [Paenibacillus aceti]